MGKLKKIDLDKVPRYDVVVNEESNESEIQLISLVDSPAIVMKGICLSNEVKTKITMKSIPDEQIIIGPALIPDIEIYREDEKLGPHYIRFSKNVIKKLVYKFNRFGTNRKINIDHENRLVEGFIAEDWIIEDSVCDKSRKYGFELPIGTYMMMAKIEDKQFWDDEVKGLGKYGFSIEGSLDQILVSMSKIEEQEVTIDDLDLDDLIKIFEIKKVRIRLNKIGNSSKKLNNLS